MNNKRPWIFGWNRWRVGFQFTVGESIYIQVWRWTAQRERAARGDGEQE